MFVGRPKSIKALEAAMEGGKHIMLVAQKAAAKDEPTEKDLYEVGCIANILQMLKLPDGTVKVLVEGLQRAKTLLIEEQETMFSCELMPLEPDRADSAETEALRRAIVSQFDQYVKLNKKIPPEILTSLSGIDEAGRLADTIAAHLPLKLDQKQNILEMFPVIERLEHLLAQLEAEIDILQVEKRIRGRKSKVNNDLTNAERVLDEDHFGLEKVKERILEYLAVQQRVDKVKAPILCLVGPPGVGKTSLGQSIARATNRKFVRMALGGVHDESEIRGHRRTYIGSMPGKVLQSLTKAGVRNPLFLLDEVDKMGMDYRGDPSSALLEVLDPEQNHTFADHYVEVDFDLSDVMFVATSNSLNIPAPLLDRMEVIRLSGYTEDEKVNIAQRYLLPKQKRNNGLKEGEIDVTEQAVRDIIRYYTREAGVRSLEREISKICRKVVKMLLLKKADNAITIDSGNLDTFLGAALMPGKGNVIRTGSLGDVMKESVEAARSVVRSRSRRLGITDAAFEKKDIHIHVPEGATPKDGPSAGIAMTTALVSVFTGIPVRADVAMTGEITLRGEVLPIGGLKEKLLAAHRGGIKLVLIPEENVKDLAEIPDTVKNSIEIVP
ncbi:hypothetical protein DFQ30_002284, partial [Apophysomyces sp. BC1015]